MGKKILLAFCIIVISVSSVIAASFSVMTYNKYALTTTHSEEKEIKQSVTLSEFTKPSQPEWTPSQYRKAHISAASRLSLGRNEEAAAAYKKILDVNPYDAEAYKILAYISAGQATEKQDMAQLNEALEYMEKAFELTPGEMGEKDETFLNSLQKQLGKQD